MRLLRGSLRLSLLRGSSSELSKSKSDSQAIEERRKRRQHLLNAQRVEGNDGLRRTRSSEGEQQEAEEDSSSRLEGTSAAKEAASKGDSQWKSLKSRGATGAGQVGASLQQCTIC